MGLVHFLHCAKRPSYCESHVVGKRHSLSVSFIMEVTIFITSIEDLYKGENGGQMTL